MDSAGPAASENGQSVFSKKGLRAGQGIQEICSHSTGRGRKGGRAAVRFGVLIGPLETLDPRLSPPNPLICMRRPQPQPPRLQALPSTCPDPSHIVCRSPAPPNGILLTNREISCLGWICPANCPANETVCSLYRGRTTRGPPEPRRRQVSPPPSDS